MILPNIVLGIIIRYVWLYSVNSFSSDKHTKKWVKESLTMVNWYFFRCCREMNNSLIVKDPCTLVEYLEKLNIYDQEAKRCPFPISDCITTLATFSEELAQTLAPIPNKQELSNRLSMVDTIIGEMKDILYLTSDEIACTPSSIEIVKYNIQDIEEPDQTLNNHNNHNSILRLQRVSTLKFKLLNLPQSIIANTISSTIINFSYQHITNIQIYFFGRDYVDTSNHVLGSIDLLSIIKQLNQLESFCLSLLNFRCYGNLRPNPNDPNQLFYRNLLELLKSGGCNRLTSLTIYDTKVTSELIDYLLSKDSKIDSVSLTTSYPFFIVERPLKQLTLWFIDVTGMSGINVCEPFELMVESLSNVMELDLILSTIDLPDILSPNNNGTKKQTIYYNVCFICKQINYNDGERRRSDKWKDLIDAIKNIKYLEYLYIYLYTDDFDRFGQHFKIDDTILSEMIQDVKDCILEHPTIKNKYNCINAEVLRGLPHCLLETHNKW